MAAESVDRARKRFVAGEDDDDDDDNCTNVFYRQASSKILVKSTLDITELQEEDEEESEEESPPTDEFCLSYLQAIMFATILEDCITQLRVLDECNNELRIIKTMADLDKLHARKYQIKQGRTKDDTIEIDTKKLGCMQYKLDKLAADRIYCSEVMMGTYLELAMNRCFSSITDSNKDIEDRKVYTLNLIEEEARNKNARRELMRQLRQQRNHIKSVAYDTDLIVDQLKSKVEDATLNAETRGRYIVNWQRARSEQHQQTIHDKEAGPSEAITYYRNRTDQEQRIHAEVELLVNIFIDETLQKVESWMNKYDTDMEAIDLKIQIMKNRYQDEIDRRVGMEEMYAYHEVLMKNWTQFKEDRSKALAYTEKMTKSAIIVQSWWRGLLVRLELGPYKPKKKAPLKPVEKKKK